MPQATKDSGRLATRGRSWPAGPTPATDRGELRAAKRPFATCDKLTALLNVALVGRSTGKAIWVTIGAGLFRRLCKEGNPDAQSGDHAFDSRAADCLRDPLQNDRNQTSNQAYCNYSRLQSEVVTLFKYPPP